MYSKPRLIPSTSIRSSRPTTAISCSSARHTWTLYKVNRATGAIMWRLGGKDSDFSLGPGVRFAWQHDARQHPGGVISLFDDEAPPAEASQSRGLFIRADESTMTATFSPGIQTPEKGIVGG